MFVIGHQVSINLQVQLSASCEESGQTTIMQSTCAANVRRSYGALQGSLDLRNRALVLTLEA